MSTALELDHGTRTVRQVASAAGPVKSTQRRFRHVTPPPHAAGDADRSVLDFDFRVSRSGDLVDPAPLLINLARCVTEVIAGVRSLDQVARWVSDDVYTTLLRRVTIAARSRAITGGQARRPRLSIGSPMVTHPREGVVEAVVMVHQRSRSRAVAIRLEALDDRWRASAITVL
ncbi:Rv3235 family protein [Leifsonia sp. NPDC058230]|uniref:Rv3235 family protein n=1 Tax=Leifsonia sp. NPDC058230 TaxID=3346391 RepID=UPI0036DB2104